MEEQKKKFDKSFGGAPSLNANQRAQMLDSKDNPSQGITTQVITGFTPAKNSGHTDKFLTFVIEIPFRVSDPGKFLRFQSYVLDKEGQLVTFDVPNNMMTGSQIRLENLEFDRLFKLNKRAIEVGDLGPKKDEYQKGVYTSEMKNQSAGDIQKKIETLERSINRREERDWQPAHLLLTRCGIMDPHESKKIKPPMYFKNMEQ